MSLRQRKKYRHYIFHSAFCGSTLLSRALNEPGQCLSIREPYALTQLSAFKRANPAFVAQWGAWPKLALYFIARGYFENEVTVIKPSNSANNLIPDLMALNIDTQALMLSTSLPQFMQDKAEALSRCNQLFGLGLSSKQLESKLGNDIFKRHAKEQKGGLQRKEKAA